MKKFSQFILSAFIIFGVISCGGSSTVTPAKNKVYELYVDFWNASGKTPEIKFDQARTSPEVKVDLTKTFGGFAEGNSFTKVVVDNFRILDNSNNNYSIKKITAYEFRTDINNWKEDVEFRMDYSVSEEIAITLVLDRSESLGTDFDKVKTYAIDFIEKVFKERKNVQMSIVDFADDIKSLPMTSDKEALKSYVNSLKQGRFTTLYDAMNLGIDHLKNVSSQNKVLLVFTDGTDNNSKPTTTPDFLLNKLRLEVSNQQIVCFTIGLDGKGGVDKPVLTKLALYGGSEIATNSNDLKSIFEKFSGAIANVYSLTYLRNQQIIPKTKPVKLKFEIETVKL